MPDPTTMYLTADVWVESPHRAYGLLLSPHYLVHDEFDQALDQSGAVKTNCYIDRNARLLMARPTPLIMDTILGGGGSVVPPQWVVNSAGGLSTAWHDDTVDPDTGKRCLLMDDANVGVTGQVYTAAALPAGYIYFAKIVKGSAASDAPHDPTNCYWIWTLGWDATHSICYRIEARMGQPFALMTSTDGATWTQVRTTEDIPDCEAYLEANDRTCTITVIPAPLRNMLAIYIGNGDGELTYTSSTLLLPNDVATFESRNGKARLTFFPAGLPISWSFQSGAKEISFTPRSKPSGRLWPDGAHHKATASTPDIPAWDPTTTASITVTPDPNFPGVVRYTVTGSGTQDPGMPAGYGLKTVMLEYAEIDWPPVSYNDTFDVPVRMPVDSIVERHTLDWNNLNLVRQATIVADNYHGEWSFSSGTRAVSIARGWNGVNLQGFVGWLGETTDYHRADPFRKVTFNAFDRSFPLRRRRCGILPFLDGWCLYAAIRFLANIGGIKDEWLVYIPACPTGPAPQGCTHPLLPVGTGTQPRMKPNPQAVLWSEMNRIRALYRHLLGFDYFGYLRCEPFDVTQLPYFGQFSTVPAFDSSGTPYLNEITGNWCVTASVADVRSDVTLIGINPSDGWSPIVVHNANDSVVYNTADPAFLGFYDPWVDVDPIYTNQAFMQTYADLMSQQTGLPTVDVQLGAHMQPGLHLLDRFLATEPLTLGTAEFYTVGHVLSYARQGDFFAGISNVHGKSVANLFG